MKLKNIMIEIEEQNLSHIPTSAAEMRRLSWFVESLKVVRVGSFLNNIDEVAHSGNSA